MLFSKGFRKLGKNCDTVAVLDMLKQNFSLLACKLCYRKLGVTEEAIQPDGNMICHHSSDCLPKVKKNLK